MPFLPLLLSLFVIVPNTADIKQCSSCLNQQIWCPDGEDCTVNCYDQGCANSIIYCPRTRHKCNIECVSNTGQRSCENLLIDAIRFGNGNATELTVNAVGHNDIFQGGTVICPPFTSECNINCESVTACRGIKINATTSIYTNISITATGSSAITGAQIYGAAFGNMDIHCNGHQACFQTLIQSHPDSLLLNINATGSNILEQSTIYCPNNGADKDVVCTLQIAGDRGINMAKIYAAEAFYDVDIICDDSYHEGCMFAELYCDAPTYSDSCSLQKYGNTFGCDLSTRKCQTFSYPPTEQPTTAIPTTLQPTTHRPTTLNPTIDPTTSIPTTSIPTTSIPTTLYLTINPSTSIPTSSIPTTVNPTINPSTYNPTTAIPTTTLNPTIYPTTSTVTEDPTMFPSTYTLTTSHPTGSWRDLYGVALNIRFQYDVFGNISDALLNEIFVNITEELIETEMNEIKKECIRKKDYIIDIDKLEKIVIINAMIYVCNKQTENTLSVYSQNDLETDLIDIIDDNPILMVKNPDISIQVNRIKMDGEIMSTLVALNTSSDLNKNINFENNTSDPFMIIITVFGCIIFICILVIIFVCIRNVKKDKKYKEDTTRINGADTGRDRVCTNSATSYKIGEPAKPPCIETSNSLSRQKKELPRIQMKTSLSIKKKKAECMPNTPLTADAPNGIETDIIIKYDDDEDDTPGTYLGVQMTAFPRKQTLGEESDDNDGIKGNEEDGIMVKQWLIHIDLEKYYNQFIENGYESLEFIKEIKDKQSLIEIGICEEMDIIKLIQEIKIVNGNNNNNEVKTEHIISESPGFIDDNTSKGIDLKNYKNWDIDDIIIWIKSLENGRYNKYLDILINGLKICEISSDDLPDLDRSDLTNHPFNINNFKDKKDLIDHFKSLSKASN